MNVRDAVDEALLGVTARPARLALTTLGTMLGIAALVSTVGLAQTAASQISDHFDLARATEVTVEPKQSVSANGDQVALTTLPWTAAADVMRLNGSIAAGTISPVLVTGDVHAVAVDDPTLGQKAPIPVLATSPGTLDAIHGTVVTGRYFDAGHDRRGDRVVVLGSIAAKRLGVNRVDQQPAIFIGNLSFEVMGIITDVSTHTEMLDSVIMPDHTAEELFALTSPASLEIRTALGAALQVGRQAPVALDPNDPSSFDVHVPPTPVSLRNAVRSDVNSLFLVLGAVALLIGMVGIANVTLLSVLERVGEIGLRRALGATRRHIATQFLLESVAIGFLGGLIGTSSGILVTVGISVNRAWDPVLSPVVAAASPALGAVIGLLAGTYPAWKASAIEPIEALRRDG